MRKAFFVIGQEGSGTYMMANALTEASQLINCEVIRRSVPHAHQMPYLGSIYNSLIDEDLDVIVVIIIREMWSTLFSINRRDTTKVLSPVDYHDRLHYILKHTEPFRAHCEFVTYEAFVNSENYRRFWFKWIGLPYPEEFGIFNANNKYYQEVANV